jgi:AraC-like DNA-binding protein
MVFRQARFGAAATAMNAPMNGLQVSQFSTASYRPHERVAAWREEFGRTILRIDLAPSTPEHFRASATAYRASNFGLLRASTSAVHQSNSPELIASDDVTFGVIANAPWGASQFGRSAELRPGDGAMLNNGEVGSISLPRDCHYVAFAIPQSAIRPLVPDLDAMFARRIPASNAALRMLMRYLELAVTDGVVNTPELEAAFTNHIIDLLALTLGATRDAAEFAKGRGLPAARLAAIKADVVRNLGRFDLSIEAIARSFHITPRQVQRLFELDGMTFTEFVLRERLAYAHRLLCTPTHAARPISAVALEAGFGDLSYFNRSFRRRYGTTPSDVRETARGR